jgi:hypothetical protein
MIAALSRQVSSVSRTSIIPAEVHPSNRVRNRNSRMEIAPAIPGFVPVILTSSQYLIATLHMMWVGAIGGFIWTGIGSSCSVCEQLLRPS